MEEINFIRPQEVFNRNTGESKVRYTSYDGSNKFIPVVDGEDGVPRTLVVTTHAELKAMRDAGKLTPGALYRITDYQCTTTQANTRSAGHQFDIVLLALSNNKLAEEGWAMMHENDTYFANSNLSAWKVWYCLDNDKSRFAWAQGLKIMYKYAPFDDAAEVYVSNITRIYNNQTYYSCLGISDDTNYNLYVTDKNINQNTTFYTFAGPGGQEKPYIISSVTIIEEGTGVIYRLIDEWNNDVPYDFKNIQYKRQFTDGDFDPEGTDTVWVYTLSSRSGLEDRSIVANEDESICANNNKVGFWIYNDGVLPTFRLSNNVIFEGWSCSVTGNDSYNNTLFGRGSSVHLGYDNIVYAERSELRGCDEMTIEDEGIYIDNKKVLTEDALNDIETLLSNI